MMRVVTRVKSATKMSLSVTTLTADAVSEIAAKDACDDEDDEDLCRKGSSLSVASASSGTAPPAGLGLVSPSVAREADGCRKRGVAAPGAGERGPPSCRHRGWAHVTQTATARVGFSQRCLNAQLAM